MNPSTPSTSVARNLIDGIFTEPDDIGVLVGPATGSDCSRFAESTTDEVDAAIDAAAAVSQAGSWAASPRQRASVLLRFADAVERDLVTLATLETTANGKVLDEARHEILAAISEARFYSSLARTIFGRTISLGPGETTLLQRDPLPVSAIIVPSNAPAALLVRSLAPAIAAGTAVVVKPAAQTALVTDHLVRLMVEAGMPAGTLNVVHGDSDEIGRRLVESDRVDGVSFTGSTRVGIAIMEAGAKTLKRLNLELGGSAPCIVLADADVDLAASTIVRSVTSHAGQVCVSASRVIADRSISGPLTEALSERLAAVRVGDPMSPDTEMGPVIDERSRTRLVTLAERARAAFVTHVDPKPIDHPTSSCYLTPGLFEATDAEGREIFRDEVFGPILSLHVVDGEAEAIERANDTRFGLAASVWTDDLATGQRVAQRIQAGTVWINSHHRLAAEIETGGYRLSGIGRLHGLEGLDAFLQTKAISYRTDL